MQKEWKWIPGFEGRYEISCYGEVRSWLGEKKRGKKLPVPYTLTPVKSFVQGNSRYAVKLNGKIHRVRSLMRDVWMDGAKPGFVVWCKDGDYTNCSLWNLEYITREEMNKRKINGNRKPVIKREKGKKDAVFYPSLQAAAEDNFLTPSGVLRRIKNRRIIDGVMYEYDR